MTSDSASNNEVAARLQVEFVEDFQDRLEIMKTCLHNAADEKKDSAAALREFQRELHSIKGTGGAFGFPCLSLICHRFEECLLQLSPVMFGSSRIVKLYVDQLNEIAVAEQDPSEQEYREILQSLPFIGDFDEDGNKSSEPALEALVVAGSGTIRHKIRSDLSSFGFHVAIVPDGIVAISMIIRGQPDLVVISGTVDSMSGFDLIRALVTMKATDHIRIIAMTSHNLEHPEVLMLPEGIPVIQLKANLEGQIAKALSAVEYRFL